MRCYFVRADHLAGVEMLTGLSDKDAIAKALLLFSERSPHFDGVEVWEGTRFVFTHPPVAEKPEVQSGPELPVASNPSGPLGLDLVKPPGSD